MTKKILKTLIFFLLLFPLTDTVFADTVQYISPVPDSKYNNERTNIILGYNIKLTPAMLNKSSMRVTGSASGVHTGTLSVAEKNYRLIFTPDVPFTPGEKVTVSGIKEINDFSFYIRNEKVILPDNYSFEFFSRNSSKNMPFHRDFLVSPDSLPAFTIFNSGNTASGYLFFSNFQQSYSNGNFLMMLQNNGSPFWARRLYANGYDFKKQNNNLLTYYEEMKHFYYGLDFNYNKVDSFFCGNGYETDLHEVRVMPDGSAWLMSYDPLYIDMSGLVPGGKSNALVTGLIIQKINAAKTVVFQWRSWDYFEITDATHEDLTSFNIDYVHGNAIEVDNDGNIMISSRHMDEITKINSSTGEIIWRFGGKNNQFLCDNDTIGFSHQHFVRRLTNGNVMLFDNGNYHSPPFSRAIEYKLDEETKLAHVDWQYRHSPDIYAFAMGSAQRLSNGNTLIGWGSATTTLTEVNPSGQVVYELSLPAGQMSYRAYRDDWGTFTGIPSSRISEDFKLYQNYPNPFNPSTNIKYSLSKNTNVTLKVYDMLGREVATLVNEFQKAGIYEKQFTAGKNSVNAISSGIYYFKLQAGDYAEVKKMVLLK